MLRLTHKLTGDQKRKARLRSGRENFVPFLRLLGSTSRVTNSKMFWKQRYMAHFSLEQRVRCGPRDYKT
jgi:hypothetical protein